MKRLAHAALLAFAAAAGTAAGCVQAQTERCTDVCSREAECAEARRNITPELEFDARECAIECTRLEREREGRELVSRHIECVDRAASCAEVLECP